MLFSLQDTSWSYRNNANDILRLNIPSPAEYINTNTICGNTAGLSRQQYQLCINEPAAIASAIQVNINTEIAVKNVCWHEL